jgi:hypothetical protein
MPEIDYSKNFDQALHKFVHSVDTNSGNILNFPINRVLDLLVTSVHETHRLRSKIEDMRACARMHGTEQCSREATSDQEIVVALATACHAVGVKPHTPRLHAMLKACGLPSIPRQRLKELLSDYLR